MAESAPPRSIIPTIKITLMFRFINTSILIETKKKAET